MDAGVNSVITSVTGGTGTGGNFKAGDAPVINFTLKNDALVDIGLAALDQATTFFFGPNQNRQAIMPLTSGTGYQASPYDFTGRLQTTNPPAPAATSSSPSLVKGSMSKVFLGTPAVAEVLTVEFTSATTFSVTGSTTGPLGTGTLPSAASSNPTSSSSS